jgi:SIR2-like domain
MSNLDDSAWEILVDRIRTGKCTPFLGAGVNYGFLPTGAQIAQDWAIRNSYPLHDGTESDLARVAQFVATKTGDPMRPKDAIVSEFREKAKEQDFSACDNPLGVLAELPLPIFITTNYDDYLTQALIKRGKKPKRELCRWNSRLDRLGSVFDKKSFVPTKDEPVVFHVHGHQDVPESIVLTEDDYLEFLVSLSKRSKELLSSRIQEALAGTSLLFIGYRLADWDLRVLLHGLLTATEKSLRRASISVQLPPDLPPEHLENAVAYLERYFGELKISLFWGKAADFAKKLGDLWHESEAKAARSSKVSQAAAV